MVTEKERLLAIAKEALGRLPVGAEFQLSDLVAAETWTEAPKGARLAAGMAFRAPEFQLSDLVAAETWTEAPKGARLAAGMAFRAAMDSDTRIDSLGRDAENHQRYRKTSH